MRADEPIDAALAARVREHVRKLEKRLAKAKKKRSPDAVHDGRTAIRRVTEALTLMGWTAWDAGATSRLADELEPYEDALAKTRDCDVLTSTVRAWAREHRRDAKGLAELEHRLAKRRDKAARKMKRALRGAHGTASRLDALAQKGGVAEPKKAAKAVPALVRHFVREIVWRQYDAVLAYDGRRSADPEIMHAFRAACRRLRYALELVGDVADGDHVIAELRAVQEEAGTMHDHVVASALVDEWLRRGKLHESPALRRFTQDLSRSIDRARSSILKRFDRVMGERFRAELGRALEAA
ncbi:MAG TPA: CHAD domain-containing protein [Labilithrix sp.]|jgi:CHAD domain-containing protein